MRCVPRVDDDRADVELLVAERLGGGADVVLAQPHLQNVADRPDEGKAETGGVIPMPLVLKGLLL